MRTTSVALVLLLLLPAPTLGSEGEVQRVLLAGDIASCDWTADTVTGHLGAARDGVVMTVGDHVYQLGTTSQFQDCYEPTWGRVRDRTRLELQLSAGGHTWAFLPVSGSFRDRGSDVCHAPPGEPAIRMPQEPSPGRQGRL